MPLVDRFTAMFCDKLSEVLVRVDQNELKANIDWYRVLERARQYWEGECKDKLIETPSANYSKKISDRVTAIMSYHYILSFGRERPDCHKVIARKIKAIVAFADYYSIVCGEPVNGKQVDFDQKKCKSDLDKHLDLADESALKRKLDIVISSPMSSSDYKDSLKRELFAGIGVLCNSISKYFNDNYASSAKTIFESYKKRVYEALAKTRESRSRGRLTSSIRAGSPTRMPTSTRGMTKEQKEKMAYDEKRFQTATKLLGQFGDIARDAGQTAEEDLCRTLLLDLQK